MVGKIRGLHPPTSTIVKQTAEDHLESRRGRAMLILVGRAANVITEKLTNVLHVRLVGSLENRIARVEEVYEMAGPTRGNTSGHRTQRSGHYMKEYFGREI